MWDLVRFVSMCSFIISTFYIFYQYEIEDIKGQSYVLKTCKKETSTGSLIK